jgi:hypothetical protein
VIVALAPQCVEIYNVKLVKIVPLVLAIVGPVPPLTPIVVTDTAIQVVGKIAHHAPMIADHVHMSLHVEMVLVIQIMVKIVVPVLMIVDNVLLQTRIVVMAYVTQKLLKPVVLVKQIVEHAKAPVIGMGIVSLNILKM